jgi:hypothetical protein
MTWGIPVRQLLLAGGSSGPLANELQAEPKGVAVTCQRVTADTSLFLKALAEEALQQV